MSLLFFFKRILRYNLFIAALLVIMTTAFAIMYGNVPITISLVFSRITSFFIYLTFPSFYGSVFLFHLFNRNEWIFFLNLGFSRVKLVLYSQIIIIVISFFAVIAVIQLREMLL